MFYLLAARFPEGMTHVDYQKDTAYHELFSFGGSVRVGKDSSPLERRLASSRGVLPQAVLEPGR